MPQDDLMVEPSSHLILLIYSAFLVYVMQFVECREEAYVKKSG